MKISEITSSIVFFPVGFTSCAISSIEYMKGSVIQFPDVLSNVGISDIATFKSTGKFKCTMEGLFHVSVSILSNTKDTRFGIYMSGHLVSKAYTYNTDIYQSGTGIAVVALNINDELWIQSMDGKLHVDGYASCITIVKIY